MSRDEHTQSSEKARDELAAVRRESNVHSYGVIKKIMGNRPVDNLPLRLRCECATAVCEKIIEVNLSQRRELRRAYPTGFIVVPSHVNAHDHTLYKTAEYCVIEKLQFTESITDL